MKTNKWLYLYVIQGYYDTSWEDVTTEETYREARARLREYRENEPEHHHRMIKRRELNPEYKEG